MVKIIREQVDQLLGKQQWWDLGSNFKVLVSLDANVCSLHVADLNGNDITELIGNKLNAETKKEYKITAGIDSYFVEISESDLITTLNRISSYLNKS